MRVCRIDTFECLKFRSREQKQQLHHHFGRLSRPFCFDKRKYVRQSARMPSSRSHIVSLSVSICRHKRTYYYYYHPIKWVRTKSVKSFSSFFLRHAHQRCQLATRTVFCARNFFFLHSFSVPSKRQRILKSHKKCECVGCVCVFLSVICIMLIIIIIIVSQFTRQIRHG